MTDLRADAELVQGVPQAPTTEESVHEAPWTILADPALGISGMTYVGGSERDMARLIVAARAHGLLAEVTRGKNGALRVRFAAPADSVARAPTADAPLASSPGAGLWARLWAGARRLAAFPGRRES
jgi:hypothetical protein